jgi:hypothetical protein
MSSYKSHPKTQIHNVHIAKRPLDVNVVSGNLGEISVGDVTIGAVEISGGTYLTQPVEISGGIGDIVISSVEISGGTYLTQPVEISGDVNVRLSDNAVEISGGTYLTQPVEISGDVNVRLSDNAVEISGGTYLTQPVEISGDVNVRLSDNTVEISGGTYLTQPVEISGDVNVRLSDNAVEISGETNVSLTTYNDDAFGRLRVSQPYTLFDFTSVFGKNPLDFDEEISGSATSVHNEGSYILMSVNGSDGARVVRQTREYIPYQPGKSKLTYLTGVLTNNITANFTSRIGNFDNSSGNFLEYSNGTISIVERDNGNEIRVPRSNWIDPLDGTGSSGLNIDFTKAQIFWFDQEWLGVGRVRAGIVANGKYYQCIHFNHNGPDAVLKPYYRLAKLPIRFEIQSHGDSGTMRMICGTVLSEGGFNNLGTEFATKEYTFRSIDQTNDGLKPIISLRLRDISDTIPHLYTTLKLKSFDILNLENSRVLGWKILWNPTLTLNNGTFEDYDTEYSSAQICYHGTNDGVSGGLVFNSGLSNQRANFYLSTTPDEIISSTGIGRSISGVSDTITLACEALTGGSANIDFYTTMTWIEIR